MCLFFEFELVFIVLAVSVHDKARKYVLLVQPQFFEEQFSCLLKTNSLNFGAFRISQIKNAEASTPIAGQVDHSGPDMTVLNPRVIDDFFYRVNLRSLFDQVRALGILIVLN